VSTSPLRTPVRGFSLLACVLVTVFLPACASQIEPTNGCLPGDCPDVRTQAATDGGKTVVMEVGQWISMELPGPNADVTGSSSNPAVLELVGKQRLLGGGGRPVLAYMSFHALKAGSAHLTFGYRSCDQDTSPCSYAIDVRVVQFPKTKTTLWVGDPSQAPVKLHVGESMRFQACCQVVNMEQPNVPVDQPMPTIDRPGVLEWAVDPFVDHRRKPMSINAQRSIEGAVTAVAPGTAHIQGIYCPRIDVSSCPSSWSVTVVVT